MFLRDSDVTDDQGMLFAFPDVQLGDQSRHRGYADLFGRGERADGLRPAEDENGKRREARCAQAGRIILAAQAAQQVDGGGVEPVGHGVGGAGAGRARRDLTRCHDGIC